MSVIFVMLICQQRYILYFIYFITFFVFRPFRVYISYFLQAKLDAHVLRRHINDPKKRVYKTKAMGRCVRKDEGTFKLSTALKLAGLFQKPSMPGPSFTEKTEICNVINSIKAS